MKRKTITIQGILYTLFFLSSLFIFIASCSKTNNTVITGTSTNAIKTISSVGPAGPRSSLVYYGNGALQDSTIGCFGDYYLNVSQGLLYGPKSVYSWGTAVSLQGASGAENQVYSGTEIPANSFGNTGDYYLDTKTFILYGPKTSTGWNNSIDLNGSGE